MDAPNLIVIFLYLYSDARCRLDVPLIAFKSSIVELSMKFEIVLRIADAIDQYRYKYKKRAVLCSEQDDIGTVLLTLVFLLTRRGWCTSCRYSSCEGRWPFGFLRS